MDFVTIFPPDLNLSNMATPFIGCTISYLPDIVKGIRKRNQHYITPPSDLTISERKLTR